MIEVSPTGPKGDWQFYKWRMHNFRAKCMPENDPTLQESMRLQGVDWMKQYLGDEPRCSTKEPRVLTPAFIEKLAAENQARRWRQHPHFARVAALFNQIAALEKRYDGEQNK